MIKDLLWACVVCHKEESLWTDRGKERCENCGAHYWRGDGARIVVEMKDGTKEERRAGEWISALPPVKPGGSAKCALSIANGDVPIYAYREYFGRYEKFGPAHLGMLHLDADRLWFEYNEKLEDTADLNIPLLDLTAIQLSSSTLQIKARGKPVMTIRFAQSSPKLWDEKLQLAVQSAWTRAGRGTIVEYQPRIVGR
ncbi:MAG TPA: hypothetical protein VM100_13525 [Longimicrobiales bacterium]|nr:hypothetical protein [Longimicrobiales bacterium]